MLRGETTARQQVFPDQKADKASLRHGFLPSAPWWQPTPLGLGWGRLAGQEGRTERLLGRVSPGSRETSGRRGGSRASGLSVAHRLLQPLARATPGYFWLKEDTHPTEAKGWVHSEGTVIPHYRAWRSRELACVNVPLLIWLLEAQTSSHRSQRMRGEMAQPRALAVLPAEVPQEGKPRCTTSLSLAGSQLSQRQTSRPKGLGTAQPSPCTELRSQQSWSGLSGSLSPCAQTRPAARHDRTA